MLDFVSIFEELDLVVVDCCVHADQPPAVRTRLVARGCLALAARCARRTGS